VPELAVAMRTVREAGAGAVLVSRAEAPALLVDDDGEFQVSTPSLEPVDHHGAGDSMTAGVAAGLALGLPFGDAVRLGAAAGSLNVTRRGLATGERGAIERLAELVELVPVDGVDPPAPRRTTPDDLAAQVDASLRGG
jgi:1-phosphofructokinase